MKTTYLRYTTLKTNSSIIIRRITYVYGGSTPMLNFLTFPDNIPWVIYYSLESCLSKKEDAQTEMETEYRKD